MVNLFFQNRKIWPFRYIRGNKFMGNNSVDRVAIISTYDDLCGIAGFTKQLVKNLSTDSTNTAFKVFDLDQLILRLRSRRGRNIGDRLIKKIAAEISNYDHVNIQLEYGTLGYYERDIFKRFRLLASAAKSLSVTFHTIKDGDTDNKFRFFKKNKMADLQSKTVTALKKMQKNKSVSVFLHSKRDARFFEEVVGLKHVYHHPLCFYSHVEVANVLSVNNRSKFQQLSLYDSSSVVVGVFGFISSYKGIETAIKAMELLPENYLLAIFGGLHPHSIRNYGSGHVDQYLTQIINSVHAGEKLFEMFSNEQLHLSGTDLITMSERSSVRDISNRVQFMGSLRDEMFPAAVAACDICVFPYYEVGQASSGPISIANEMGSQIIASRTKAFMRFEKYFPNRISFFDIGNYVHLSQLISSSGIERKGYPENYNVSSLCDTYRSVFFKDS